MAIYQRLTEDQVAGLRVAVDTTKASRNCRTSGLPQVSSVFGVLPRHSFRHDYCRFTSHTRKERDNHNAMFNFAANTLTPIYQQHRPTDYKDAMEHVAENIHPDWVSNSTTPFLTSNINVNHAIRYHRDAGNIKNSYSNVLILKRDLAGGHLVLPEYGVALSQNDRFLVLFNGQDLIHGVTPIKPNGPNPQRASLVWYTLGGMTHCQTPQDELSRAKGVFTTKATKRAAGNNPLENIKKF